MPDKRKVVLVGAGMVGMSYAYALLNQNAADELVLIDIDEKRARGEVMDLNHGLAFSHSHMKISAGSYADCGDADILVICAGVAQRNGEPRLTLLGRNAEVFRSIVESALAYGFSGLFLIATNPVDVMTRVTQKLSGFDPKRVIGTGTTLDTARLRYLLGDHFGVDPRNMHAYVIGEHGDSEFVPWSQSFLATKPILEVCREECPHKDSKNPASKKENGCAYCGEMVDKIAAEVRDAAKVIIDAKKATYYGIGMAMIRITRAIFGNEKSVLTVSAQLNGEYGRHGVYAGVPAVVGRGGVERIIQLQLTDEEKAKMNASCDVLEEAYGGLGW